MKLTTIAAAASLAVASMSASAATYVPGTYTYKVNAHNAAMTVAVTVSKHKIEKIDWSKNLETIGVGQLALEKVGGRILEKQSLGVDGVTGATISSMALKYAVGECLKQAKVSAEDLKDLKKNVEEYKALPNTMKTQVVIIGGGGSGLAAAVAASQAGADVIVLEKLGLLGGSTDVSEGALNAADPIRQPKLGIEDSVAKHIDQTLKGGHNVGNPELVKHLCEGAYPAVEWLESIGVKFKDEVGTATGALWQRSHYPATPSGNSYIRVFEKYIAEHPNVQVITDIEAKDVLKDADGRVTGVLAKHNKTGRYTLFKAEKGVIIATGGFGANVKLRQEVNTGVFKDYDLGKSIGCTNFQKSAQGSGILMGKEVGANVIGMADIQVHPCGTPGTGLMEMIRTSGRNRVFINTDGNRFVNEGAARDVLAKALLEKCPDFDVILTAEAKGIPLAYEMSRQSGKQWIPARKGVKGYMTDPVIVEDQSITTAGKQTLVIDKKDLDYMNGKRILVVDDVISTGGSLHALDALAARSSGTIVAQAAVLAEGDAAERKDIIFLEPLPLFAH